MQASAPAPSVTAGFDGGRALKHVCRLVESGPRPPGSEAIRKAQGYIATHLRSYGWQVEEHDFHGSSPLGDLAMKNIIAKIPGSGYGIVQYATHSDTVRIPNFVGADDGASGTGTMLELA
jgi:acetylornithine deacetylase/succinyl-diaminopimelate desuccinylase-like protein